MKLVKFVRYLQTYISSAQLDNKKFVYLISK